LGATLAQLAATLNVTGAEADFSVNRYAGVFTAEDADFCVMRSYVFVPPVSQVN